MILTREQVDAPMDDDDEDLIDTARAYHDLRGAVLALHRPHRIYEECDHAHQEGDSGVIDCWDFLTCEDAYLYSICSACCSGDAEPPEQAEDCATYHSHGKDGPICSTVRAVNSVGGEPRD